MSTTKKNAKPSAPDPEVDAAEATWRRRRRWVVVRGAFLGWVLALLAGSLLETELRPMRFLFLPLSAGAGGCAALAAFLHYAGVADEAARRRHARVAYAGLACGALLLFGLYARFVVRVEYAGHKESVAFLVSWVRSPACACSSAAAPAVSAPAACIEALSLDVEAVHSCWEHRWVIELALAFAYLWTLVGLGALVGPLTGPLRPPAVPATPPAPKPYLDFDLWIDHREGSTYRAKAWSGGAGFEATVNFTLPPALESGEPFRFGFADLSRGGPADGEAMEVSPEEVGEELFRTIFQGELLKSFLGCLEEAKDGPGLRIRLRLNDVPGLACLPWEYLCEARGRGFLALSSRTPVVRYLELSEGVGTLLVEPPLRVLAVISTPSEYEELAEADLEWRRLGAALEPLLESGCIEIERLAHPTHEALAERLQNGGPFHVLHFVGHGGFSEIRGEGMLVFEDAEGHGAPLSGRSLAYLLKDHPSLRLAVLNACNGARASREDAFAGTAQMLVQHGVPAVVAMQAEVTDATACRFAEKFYQALAAGLPVDTCVGEVRKALASEANPEWGTPVVYLRAADARLFSVEGLNPPDRPEIYPDRKAFKTGPKGERHAHQYPGTENRRALAQRR